jgi:hypothetical protein
MNRDAASGNISVRRLCRSPKILSDEVPSPPSPHPLGLGIKNRHQYSIPGDKAARLPKSDSGLLALRESISHPIPRVSDSHRAGAWRALLVDPTLLVQLPRPDATSMSVIPPGVDEERLRVLGLGAVLHPPEAGVAVGGVVATMPVAGVARLALLTDSARRDVAVGGWLHVHWLNSTYDLAEQLEYLHQAVDPKSGGRATTVTILADKSADPDADGHLQRVGSVLGFEVTVLRGPAVHTKASAAMKHRAPTHLLIGRSLAPRVVDVIDLFRKAGREPLILDDSSDHRLIDGVRRCLIEAAMLTPSLTCWPAPDRDAEPDAYTYVEKRPLPIIRSGRSMHHRTTRFRYVEDLTSGYWYTSDHANHSSQRVDRPVAFKQYKARPGAGLEWVADLDAEGNPIEKKHKGPEYRFIPWTHLNG